jgi:hypothetical protein
LFSIFRLAAFEAVTFTVEVLIQLIPIDSIWKLPLYLI